jgi:hypothetical protein
LLLPPTPANSRVRHAAHALAANASLHGAGLTLAAARRLAAEVEELIILLRGWGHCGAFGARDMWQVIDQVNREYLGGAVNIRRYRTQAQAGSVVLHWLANARGTIELGEQDCMR